MALRSPSFPEPNPYEAPPILEAESPPADIGADVSGTPTALGILIGLCGVHILLNIAISFLGTKTGSISAVVGGAASSGRSANNRITKTPDPLFPIFP